MTESTQFSVANEPMRTEDGEDGVTFQSFFVRHVSCRVTAFINAVIASYRL